MVLKKAISLFSGCGGSDYALQKLGYKIVWANDIWQTACDTYKENMALNENLDKWAYYAAFWRTRDSVLVAAKRCAFSSR
jgi:site-specific DNA-cytosine methylase